MSIQPLPPDVVAQIKSSITITSLNAVICELVKNSLDANAAKVDINVDYSRGSCSVEDDGLGILPSEFQVNGHLGKLYREFLQTFMNAKLTCNRFIQAEYSDSSPWRSWYISGVFISSCLGHYHVSSSSTSIS